MIRRATPDDAPVLSALARECFTQTFGHLYTAEDLTAFLDQAYSPAVLRAELEDPEYATWLLFEDAPGSPSTINANERHDTAGPDTARAGEGTQASSPQRSPIGYVTACPAHLPHPDVAPGDGEIQRLYILRGYQGAGRGTLLLRTGLEWLEREGPRTLWIGVWSENYGAQRFYARHGFEIVGEYSFMVGDHADREFITCRPSR